MSTVNSTTGSPATVTDLMATMNAKPATSGGDSVKADADKFMTLLVTQLKNQDPLNPLDNAQVTSQLAQLQTVTGVNKLNDTLNTLKASYQSSEAMQATNLIGHGVLVEGNAANLAGGKAVLGVELGSAVDNLKIVISDNNGKAVQTMDLGPQKAGVVPLAWDGIPDGGQVDASGKPVTLADGAYSFKVVATRAGEAVKDAKGLAFDSVASVTTSGADGVKLNLPTAGVVKLSDIKQVL